MTFSHLNRRLHLYLGLALLPWLFIYGISSVPFAHGQWFDRWDAAKGLPLWTLRAERAIDVAVPTDPDALRRLGRTLLDDVGIGDVSYGVYRAGPNQINVYAFTFWNVTQLSYFTDRKVLKAEDRRFRWDHFLTGLHARGGFEQEDVLARSWSVVVDLVQLSIIVWIATGVIMWWDLRGHRRWGAVALISGVVSFVVFTLML